MTEAIVREEEKELPRYVREDNLEEIFTKDAFKILKRKYLNRDNKRKIVENPKERIYTVAREIAKAEKKYNNDVDEYTKIFYEMIRNKEFSPAGRIWANAGTSIKQLFNCFVVPVKDDLDGIFQALKETALIHKQGGGTGFNFSNLRPRGSVVRGANGVASGPVSFIHNFDQETEIISQANRRGANMGILNVDHPDILEFIYSKTEEGELNNFNISVGVTDEFMESALDGGYYKLKNPMTGDYLKKEELEQLQYNIETNKAGTTPGPPYLVISDGEVIDTHRERTIGRIKDGYVELNSKKVLDTIAELAWKTADPGIVFLDKLNDGNPLFPGEKIEATNPCVTGDTLVSTEKGLVQMEEVVRNYPDGGLGIITDRAVLNFNSEKEGSSEIGALRDGGRDTISRAFKTGKKTCYRLITESGYELKATGDHKIMTTSGWKHIKDLEEEDEVLIQSEEGAFNKNKKLPFKVRNYFRGKNGKNYELNLPSKCSKELGEALGWIIGDGWLREGKDCRVGLTFGKDDQELLGYFKKILNSYYGNDIKEIERKNGVYHLSYHSKFFVDFFKKLGIKAWKSPEKRVPESIFTAPKETVLGFLRGLFSADGTVRDNPKSNSSWVALSSKSKLLLKDVQKLLLNLGIKSVMMDRSREPRRSVFEYTTKNGEKKSYDTDGVLYELGIFSASRERFKNKINFLLRRKKQDLDEIQYNKFYKEKFYDKVKGVGKVGKEEVYDLTEPHTHSMICNGLVIHQCGEQPLLPYEACNLGSINLSKMIKKENGEFKIDFDLLRETTRKAVRFLEDVNDVNKGPLPKIEKNVNENRRIGLGVMGFHDMLLKLKIPYDSDEAFQIAEKVMKCIKKESIKMSKELAEERGPFPNYEKSSLKEPRRNMSIRTIAPTGSISMVFDVNSGIEPYYSLVYNKNTLSGDSFTYVNPYFKEVAKEKGFYSEELMEKIKENKGSIQDIDEIPENVKRLFRCALDIHYKDHVKMQSIFQKYVDNAISKTINLRNEASIEDIKKAYTLAYEKGCKGVTIYRDGSKSFQILSSDSEDEKDSERDKNMKRPRDRPNIIHGTTQKIDTGFGKMYVTLNEDEKGLFELFASIGKSGGFTSSFTEGVGRLVSLALRSGVDPWEIVEELKGIRSPKMAWDKGSKIHSIPDGIGKALERYLKGEATTAQASVRSFSEKSKEEEKSDVKKMVKEGINPECPECGAILEYSEGCIKCRSCGYSEC